MILTRSKVTIIVLSSIHDVMSLSEPNNFYLKQLYLSKKVYKLFFSLFFFGFFSFFGLHFLALMDCSIFRVGVFFFLLLEITGVLFYMYGCAPRRNHLYIFGYS